MIVIPGNSLQSFSPTVNYAAVNYDPAKTAPESAGTLQGSGGWG